MRAAEVARASAADSWRLQPMADCADMAHPKSTDQLWAVRDWARKLGRELSAAETGGGPGIAAGAQPKLGLD